MAQNTNERFKRGSTTAVFGVTHREVVVEKCVKDHDPSLAPSEGIFTSGRRGTLELDLCHERHRLIVIIQEFQRIQSLVEVITETGGYVPFEGLRLT